MCEPGYMTVSDKMERTCKKAEGVDEGCAAQQILYDDDGKVYRKYCYKCHAKGGYTARMMEYAPTGKELCMKNEAKSPVIA